MIADPLRKLLSTSQSPGEKNSYESDQTDHENYVVSHSKDAISNYPFAGQSLLLCEGPLGRKPSVTVRCKVVGIQLSTLPYICPSR